MNKTRIGIRKGVEFAIAITAVVTLVLAGCGGGGSSSSGGGGSTTSTDVKSALNQTIQAGIVVTTQLQRKDQTAIVGASVNYTAGVTNAPGFSQGMLQPYAAGTTNTSGQTSIALPATAHKQQIYGAALNDGIVAGSAVNAVVGMTANGVLSVPNIPLTPSGASVLASYRGEEYQWTVASPAASSVEVSLIQVDPATGQPDAGTIQYQVQPFGGASYIGIDYRYPLVLRVFKAGTSLTSTQLNTELLPGSYRAIIFALDGSGQQVAAPYISPVITSTTATALVGAPVAQAVTLSAGKAVSLTLQTTGGASINGRSVYFFDATTYLPLRFTTTNSSGVASLTVSNSTTSVVAQVLSSTPGSLNVEANYVFSNIGSNSIATLKQQTITGVVAPNTSCTLGTPAAGITTIGSINAVTSSTSLPWNKFVSGVTQATITPGTGAFTINLFGDAAAGGGVPYTLTANNVLGCPDATPANITVAGSPITQNITVAGGGTIVGKISTKAGGAVAGVFVQIWQTSGSSVKYVTSATSDASGNYQAQVPYGTYMLWASGSVTEGIVVSSGATSATKNLVQYQLTGQVSKALGSGNQASSQPRVYVGASTILASTLGVYSINVMEGKTWFCVVPGSTEQAYAYQCNMNVLVDASTVAAAGQ